MPLDPIFLEPIGLPPRLSRVEVKFNETLEHIPADYARRDLSSPGIQPTDSIAFSVPATKRLEAIPAENFAQSLAAQLEILVKCQILSLGVLFDIETSIAISIQNESFGPGKVRRNFG